MRTFTMIVLTIAVLTSTLAAGPTTQPAEEPKLSKAEQLFQDGRTALLTGDYTKAVDLLTQAVKEDDTKTSYRLNLARALRYAGKAAQAESHLAAVLKTRPDHVEAGQLLAEVYAGQKKWKQVITVLEPLLKYRHDYTTYHLLAEAHYALNNDKKARKYFEKAVKFNPDSAADHQQLGNIYLAGNFYALAAESYQKALSLGMDSPVLHYKLGSAYFNLRNYFGRVSTLTVKTGKPGTISGRWYLIEPVPGSKDVYRVAPSNSAIYQIARAVADGLEETPDIRFLKANIYLDARRYRQAYEMFGKIAGEVPEQDKALFHYYYAESAYGIGKYDEYLSHLDEAIKLNKAAYEPTRVEAYMKVAEQYNQAGELDKYILYLGKAVAVSPQTAGLHLKLGNAYEEARQYPRAVVQWRMVLDLETDHPQRMKLRNLIARYANKPAATPKPGS